MVDTQKSHIWNEKNPTKGDSCPPKEASGPLKFFNLGKTLQLHFLEVLKQ